MIDLRTLVPYDKDIIRESVHKTGRLLVTHEAHEMYGVGGEIVSMICNDCFDDLDAPPMRYGSKFMPMPYNKELEAAVLPQVEGIVDKVLQIMRY